MQIENNQRIVVLIPAYKPDERLIDLTKELIDKDFDVMLVDDGGKEAFRHIFEACKELGAKVAVHAINLGKGRALKTGINACVNEWTDLFGIITADADGQHTPADILRLKEAMYQHPDKLVLGAREFSGDVPLRSMLGNKITRFVYRLVSGNKTNDTQTGLRGLPRCALEKMIRVEGERYEYEMKILLELRNMEIGLTEIPIETIYINDNEGSHFNPLVDSLKIYGVIFKHFFSYLFSSGLSAVVDYLLYWLFLGFGLHRFISYVLARIVSSQVNYRMNKNVVFGGRGGKNSMLKYYLLCIVQGALGAGLVWFLPTVLPISAAIIKIPVDIVLFLISYAIQRDHVFNDK